jgi:hypothetical protein
MYVFCNVWVCVCVGFVVCVYVWVFQYVDVLLTCVPVFSQLLYCFVYVYLFLFVLSVPV